MLQGIRLITFDLDDTLWPCRPVIRRAEQVVYEWLAEHAPRITRAMSLEAMSDHRRAFMRAHPELTHDPTLVRLRTLEELMARHGYPASLAGEATAVFRQARNQVTPFDDVIPALRVLRRRFLLVSVTNGNAQVEQTPLAGLFHLDLTSAQVGAAKPDPALFQAALDWAGVLSNKVLHVGDDPERDVLAARRAGIRELWLRRGPQTPWPFIEHPAPKWVLPSLTPLAEAAGAEESDGRLCSGGVESER